MVPRFVASSPVRLVVRVGSVDVVVPGSVLRKVQRPLAAARIRLLPRLGAPSIAVVDDIERSAVVLLRVRVRLVVVLGSAGVVEVVRVLGAIAAGPHRVDLRPACTGARPPLEGLVPVGT